MLPFADAGPLNKVVSPRAFRIKRIEKAPTER